MAGTNFSGPISTGEKTGNAATQTVGYAKIVKQVSIGSGASRQIVSLPPNSTILGVGAVRTSAFTGGTDFHDMNINFGTSADPTGIGMVQLQNPGASVRTRIEARQISLNCGEVGRIDLPAKSTLLRLGAIATSALAPADAGSAAVTNFGTATDFDQYGVVTGASARSSLVYVVPVSGSTDFDTGATIVVSVSAVSTNVTTGGGTRAFVEYAVADSDTGARMIAPSSGAATFDTGGTVVITMSAAATTSFTGGGVRAFIEYATVE